MRFFSVILQLEVVTARMRMGFSRCQKRGDIDVEQYPTSVCNRRLEARVIKWILDRKSREVVGWLYEWNTGEREKMWKDGICNDVIYEQHGRNQHG